MLWPDLSSDSCWDPPLAGPAAPGSPVPSLVSMLSSCLGQDVKGGVGDPTFLDSSLGLRWLKVALNLVCVLLKSGQVGDLTHLESGEIVYSWSHMKS